MFAIDKDHLSNALEAMKLSQESLKQLMALSAGGLALYFSFIAKSHSAASPDVFGILVVVCWALSLIYAAYAHYSLSSLFTSLSSHYDAHRAINVFLNAPEPSASNPWAIGTDSGASS